MTVKAKSADTTLLRAERRAGELLRKMPKSSGREVSLKSTPKLGDLGITKNQSAAWQAVPEFNSGGKHPSGGPSIDQL